MSAPQSIINICSGVRLDNRYEHSIYFADATAQQEYFAGKVVKTFPSYSYLRKSWPLQVQATMEEARSWSYLYFRNGTGKYYYYFINQVEYKNDNMVELTLELDVIQTYMFGTDKVKLLDCFVERQHTPTDAIGEHTVAEGLEIGSYWNYHTYNMEDISDMGILVLSSLNIAKDFTKDNPPKLAYGTVFNGVYSGLEVYAFDGWVYLANKLEVLEELGKIDAIVAIWMYPKNLITLDEFGGILAGTAYTWDEFDWESHKAGYVEEVSARSATLALYTNYQERLFEGYAQDVKNNKLFTHPYNLLYVTNNQGDKAEYRFEHFNQADDTYGFELYGAISPDAGVKIAPVGYNGLGTNVNYDEGITIGNYPPCAWDSDTYKVWLAQNYNQLAHAEQSAVITGLAGLGTMVVGAATGNLAMAGTGIIGAYHGYNQIQGIMAQKEDAKTQPPQAKGVFSSTVNVASGRQTFTFYYKCIRKEFARQIDDYFTMYGYRLNRVQKPNINARPAFTYVKTVGCKATGNLCTEDIVKIEAIFDNGITFWKDGDKIGDYSQNNKPQEV